MNRPQEAAGGPETGGADMRTAVRERYGAIAEGRLGGCCGSSCGCSSGEATGLEALGYSADQIAAVPEGTDLGLGCGNPLASSQLRPGDTVLDLGSGAGIDCFLAAREVGPTGRVIGVDMTPAMIERARAHAAKQEHAHVEFRLGEIEHLPAADASVDAIISNCVINLSPHKDQVFREALRVLRPGGRLLVSDLVLIRPLAPELARSVELYVGCVAGASLEADYLGLIRDAGFVEVEVAGRSSYGPGEGPEAEAYAAVRSLQVRARKPS